MESKRLGKGLEQLFSNESLYENPLDQLDEIVENAKEEEIVELNIDDLRSNPYQPRQSFDETKLQELADSIKEYGVLEPIIVKKSVKGYEIVAGERRTKACILAGVKTIPAIIRDFSDEDMMQIAVLENIQREDLNPIEEAEAYSKLLKVLNITQEELGKKLGKSRSHITNMLGLLNLPDNVKSDVLSGLISMGHAKVLSKIEDEETINDLVKKVKSDKLSVRELESLASNPVVKKKNPVVRTNDDKKYNFVEDAMTDKIGNRVRIKNNKIVIPFNSEKDLERILDILNIDINVD
jgi:ParB family chromosome partitioning protein